VEAEAVANAKSCVDGASITLYLQQPLSLHAVSFRRPCLDKVTHASRLNGNSTSQLVSYVSGTKDRYE
jgi:hypothetical protein